MDGGVTLGRGHSCPLANFKKGSRVWHRDIELVWISGVLQEDVSFATSVVKILLDNDENVELAIKSLEQLPFLRNPDILIGSDDLTTLSYLHEPAVLHNLQHRFVNRECVYTYCGIVLVAINPYSDCGNLYSDDVIQVYRGVGKQVRELDPHIYAVAEEAYFDLCEYGKNQSIIVSGESGAGKTVSAKYVMKYFASVAGGCRNGQPGIEDRVLASNPIMEAIGNAKTIRNDNSSRFGKYIQLDFGDRFEISGAQMKTYLLEKSRLVFQASNERNYHIFYQMCASADHELLRAFQLGSAEDYCYTNQGGNIYVDGIDDRREFSETVRALDLLGFTVVQQSEMLRILAGILLLGNIDFNGDDMAEIGKHCEDIIRHICSELFMIDERQLKTWLCQREIRAAGEVVRKPLDRIEATRSRDALAKMLYANLFNWVVEQVNVSLAKKEKTKRKVVERFIGVLDIYGFETFQINSFEQFCINYANEKLQQQFNQHVFKLEQEEYVREEISWVRIDFYDNQPCIELIEGRPGLIDYLDEQCKVVRGSDNGWLEQITNCGTLQKKDQLQMPKIKSAKFMIKHFAADVHYTVDGFMEKNKDSVSGQLLEVVAKSKFKFLRDVLGPMEDTSTGGKRMVKKTVAAQFRDSLKELMTVLEATRPHYVRCIKPNDVKESFYFEPKRAIQQLRACGVLETVRISAAGYPSRWTYPDFGRRYRVLYPEGKALWRDQPKKFAEKACIKSLEDGKFALGKTKIFFRTGQVALLERLRLETLSRSATRIQATWKGFVARRRYEKIKQSVRTIQNVTRAFLAYRRLQYLKMQRAAIVIQTAVRRHQAQQRFEKLKMAIIAIQAAFRAQRARREYQKMRFEHCALTIQRYWRGYQVRRERVHYIRKVIKAQSCVRRWLAKRRLRELKIEARSVGHLQKLNHGLENKIIELQQKLDVQTNEAKNVAPLQSQMKLLDTKLLEMQEKFGVQNREISRLEGVAANVEMLSTEINVLQGERPALLAAKERMEELEIEIERLQVEVDVKDGQRSEAENRFQTLTCQLEQMRVENDKKNRDMEDEMNSLREKVRTLEEEKKVAEDRFGSESTRRQLAENEMTAMREQLLANATIMASSTGFSALRPQSNSVSMVGPDGNSITVKGTGNADLDDIALVLRQQTMIRDLRLRCEQCQRENERLRSVIESDALIENLDKRTSLRAIEGLRYQELECAYQKLKLELERLIAEKTQMGYSGMNVQMLLDKVIEENERRREESAELRAMLSNKYDRQSVANSSSPRPDSGHWSAAQSDAGSGSDLDEELCLERQIRALKTHVEHLNRVVTERNIEIEKLEKRMVESMPALKVSDGSVEDSLRGVTAHLNHLVAENLNLNDKFLRQSDELNEARAQLRGYTGGLGYSIESSDSDIIRLEAIGKDSSSEHSGLLQVFNVPEFAKILVCDLKPRLAKLLTPNFPAYLLLTAFRYHDHTKDETSLTTLFTTVHIMLKDTISGSRDMDLLSLWLVNTWRLYNLLRQYGEQENTDWHVSNTEVQNSQRLHSFDLDPIRTQLKARVEECYQCLMKKAIEPVLHPMIVPAILHHESSSSVEMMMMLRGEMPSKQTDKKPCKKLDDLIDFLNFTHGKLTAYGADSFLVGQVFGQMTQWICSLALNHMMFRKDLCTFEKAIQIKHNVTEVQSWLSSKGLSMHCESLEPLVQASHLLQSRKDENNLSTLCGEMTNKLHPKQVVAILQHYTPSDDFEERDVDPEFIEKVHESLRERARKNGEDQNKLIMPGTYLKPFDTALFVHSDFRLETLSLPTCLQLQQVCKLF